MGTGGDHNGPKVGHARIADSGRYIIDSEGRRVEYDDPRVVHAYVIDNSPYAKRMMAAVFERSGRKYRSAGKTDAEIMQLAKELCSGRECVPATAIVGHTLRDIYENRSDDEITLYFSLNQEGPCQNGAWPVLWDVFRQRLDARNAIFLPENSPKSRYLGLPISHRMWLGRAIIVGHYLDEAENALRVLARDVGPAMQAYSTEAGRLVESITKDNWRGFADSLRKWAKNVSRIPIRGTVAGAPKALIFGGLNLLFVHYPITDFFIGQRVIPKAVDMAESIQWLQSESMIRWGFRQGLTHPRQQFSLANILYTVLVRRKHTGEAKVVLSDTVSMMYMDHYRRRYRNIMAKSGSCLNRSRDASDWPYRATDMYPVMRSARLAQQRANTCVPLRTGSLTPWSTWALSTASRR